VGLDVGPKRRGTFLASAGGIALGILAGLPARAQTAAEARPPKAWTTSTELSLVFTDGNSDVQTFGFKNTTEYRSAEGLTRFRLDGLRSDTSDDPYLLLQPGITFEPGAQPTGYTTHGVRPGAEPDAERYFAEGRYEGNLPKKASWNAGASWDRNEDAGIENRYIVFGGLGNVWQDREDLKFRTTYGLSYTDREEEIEDPEKDRRFAGVRVTSDFMDKWGKTTTYDNDFTFNVSLKDLSDYNADLTQGVSVAMSGHLALKVSLQFIYASEPALEEVDILVRAQLIDPDGIPGNGDEFFQTVDSGGSEFKVGDGTLRKQELDTVFRTSLQITF
jgi:uncharacterized protein DUF481